MIASLDKEMHSLLKAAFKFFTHEDIVILLDTAQIVIGPAEEKHILTEEKFYEL